MLHKLQSYATDSPKPWKEVPKAICGDFGKIKEGLYAFIFFNDHDLAIFDKNSKPKVVVHGAGASMKPGKFEGGFGVRMLDYSKHLHRRATAEAGSEQVLQQCFGGGFLLDLSDQAFKVPNPARVFERYWTEAVNIFLKTNQLLADAPIKQLARAEWRYLKQGTWTSDVAVAFQTYLQEIAQRIFAMIEVGRLPPTCVRESAASE